MRRYRYLALAVIMAAGLLSSCKKENDMDFGFERFQIKEGNHFCTKGRGMNFVFKDRFAFQARFDQSAMYETDTLVNQQDINKLFGFTDHSEHPEENSARFGWRWYDNQIQIFAYVHADGVCDVDDDMKFIGIADFGEKNSYQIDVTDTSYVFTFKGNTVSIRRGHPQGGVSVVLFPYFGGNERAPHTINIFIKKD